MAVSIGELVAKLSLDAAAFQASLSDVKKNLDTLGGGGKKAADDLENAFRKLGVQSTASVGKQKQELQAAFDAIKKSGIASATDVEKAQRALQTRLAQLGSDGGRSLQLLSAAGMQADAALGRLGVGSLGLGRLLGAVLSPIGLVTAGLATLAAAVGLSVSAFIAEGRETRRLSEMMGVSAEKANELADTLSLLDLDSGMLQLAMFRLSAEIESGGKKLEQYGITARDAAGNLKEPGVIFDELREKISRFGTSTERLAALRELFGRGASGLARAFQLTGEEWDKLKATAGGLTPWDEKAQQTANAMTEKLNTLKLALHGIKLEIAALVLYPLVDLAEKIVKLLPPRSQPLPPPVTTAGGAARGMPALARSGFYGPQARQFARGEDIASEAARSLAFETGMLPTTRAPSVAPPVDVFAQALTQRALAEKFGDVRLDARQIQALTAVEDEKLQAVKRFLALREALTRRSTETLVLTEAEGLDERLAQLEIERAATDAYHQRKIADLELSQDRDAVMIRQAANARLEALGALDAKEIELRTARIRADEEEPGRVYRREQQVTEAVRQAADARLGALEAEAKAEGREADATEIASRRRLAATRAEAEQRIGDVRERVRTNELDERRGAAIIDAIREENAAKVRAALAEDLTARKALAEKRIDLERQVQDAAGKAAQAELTLASERLEREGHSLAAARMTAISRVDAERSSLASRLAEIDKAARADVEFARRAESLRVDAVREASAKVLSILEAEQEARRKIAETGARAAAALGANIPPPLSQVGFDWVAGTPDRPRLLAGLEEVEVAKRQAQEAANRIAQLKESGPASYSDILAEQSRIGEGLSATLEKIKKQYGDVPSVVKAAGEVMGRSGFAGLVSQAGGALDQLDARLKVAVGGVRTIRDASADAGSAVTALANTLALQVPQGAALATGAIKAVVDAIDMLSERTGGATSTLLDFAGVGTARPARDTARPAGGRSTPARDTRTAGEKSRDQTPRDLNNFPVPSATWNPEQGLEDYYAPPWDPYVGPAADPYSDLPMPGYSAGTGAPDYASEPAPGYALPPSPPIEDFDL